MSRFAIAALPLLIILAGCHKDECDASKPTSCDVGELCKTTSEGPKCVAGCLLGDPATCPSGQACDEVDGADPLCFAPVQVQGKVERSSDATAIAAARVAARDEGGAVIAKVALSAADGTYTLPIPAKRKADGTPVSAVITLRADAAGYATFPGGIRPALPLDLAAATKAGSAYVLENAATTVELVALSNAASLGTIRGKIQVSGSAGTLIVAGNVSGVADDSGEFAVFNAPAGPVTVRGYAANLQLSPATVTVVAGGEVAGVVLTASTTPLATVRGNLSMVNAPGGSVTSVALAVEKTFIANLEIGEVPKGLRATLVSSAFSITGVPDGKYVILPSLDNDGLVRDPDTSIGGTQIVHVEVKNGTPSVTGSSFKVTQALAVQSPGANAPEAIAGTPTFKWADDSSEDGYDLKLFDTFGNLVWEKADVPSVSGSGGVSVLYAGPALTPGMFYQFRATSLHKGVPISRTEDLRGVFSIR